MTQTDNATPSAVACAVAFHGHMCPGLAIGIRAAEVGLAHGDGGGKIVAVVETDVCAADAIQILTGATFGNGQLVHRDYGKNACTFYRGDGTSGVRAVTRPEAFGAQAPERQSLMARAQAGQATPDERKQLERTQTLRSEHILQASLDAPFCIESVVGAPPTRSRARGTSSCEQCGEAMMEARGRRFAGLTLCIPCFQRAEGS